MNRFVLTQAELAIILHYLVGEALAIHNTTNDLAVSAEQLQTAEDELYDRGILLRDPYSNQLTITGELALILEATLQPSTLAILSITEREGTGLPKYFSFTDELIVLNYVDSQGLQTFLELGTLDHVIKQIIELTTQPTMGNANLPPTAELTALMPEAEKAALLLIIKEPAAATSQPTSLSWLMAHAALWLANPKAAKPETTPVQQIDQAILSDLLYTTIQAHLVQPPS
ncbi:hypothetical protein [Herpetosiphon geysericola]|uniref:Uncharacterized protein n=1 Tax=Herpetosiphon geysericola TaxID=70996 RepID=A0A0P6XQH3_9CHLR|nr:hypothetical protein [Herpetosiphon geysericola]KPL81723.1 hypothetical protein SE18_20790 [Herpetosiphon geysericola]